MGRPTLLTPEVEKAICDNILLGLAAEEAAEMSGVSASTFYGWKRRGQLEATRLTRAPRAKARPKETPYLEFLQAVKKAQLEFKRTHVVRVQQAGREHWQASAWLLERRYPKEYGQKVLIEQQVREELEAAVDRLEQRLDPETFERVLAVLADNGDRERAAESAGGDADG